MEDDINMKTGTKIWKKCLTICMIVTLLWLLVGCSNDETKVENAKDIKETEVVNAVSQDTVPESLPDNNQVTMNTSKVIFGNESVEKYYRYFFDHNQVKVLLDSQPEISDDEMSAFAILSSKSEGENSYNVEALNQVAIKYFGRKIEQFNNTYTKLNPETNKVEATGWSFDNRIFMVLRSLVKGENDVYKAEFYCLGVSDSTRMLKGIDLTDEMICNSILDNDYSDYGILNIVELQFKEMTDELGNLTLQYISAQMKDEKIETIVPYQN